MGMTLSKTCFVSLDRGASELLRRSPDANPPLDDGFLASARTLACHGVDAAVARVGGVDDNSGETQLLNVGDILN